MAEFDLLVVGGGINGTGIARDAAGRGMRVLLVERDDLGGATSSWSSKLIHGGLRYLEQYEFGLVAEALAEREVLLRIAGHLVWPARFVMPHVAELRPRWMIRAGLFLYDHLGRRPGLGAGPRSSLPGSQATRLAGRALGAGLRPDLDHAFEYSDCRVDDARLVIANARDAAARGCSVCPRTELVAARRDTRQWHATLRDRRGTRREVTARALVNAAGPWVKDVRQGRLGVESRDDVRLVRGSHIVVPACYPGAHAFILQNDDRRVVFMIPFETRFTLIGTTDVPHRGDPRDASASDDEVEYLCRAVNRYLAEPVRPADVVWKFAGVRPLFDDGHTDPSTITRDYTLRVDAPDGAAPVLSVYGGKLTTYRHLAEQALAAIRRWFPDAGPQWTDRAPLPGSDFGGGTRAAARDALYARYSGLPRPLLRALFHRHGTGAAAVLGDARVPGDLGEDYGGTLTEREVRHFAAHEWAQAVDDVLWRRSKAGLSVDASMHARIAEALGTAS